MQFSVSFDTANSPDLGSLTVSEKQALLDTVTAAATIWSWYLPDTNVTLDLRIVVDSSLFSGNVLAVGGPATFSATGATFGGKDVYDSSTAIKLNTGTDITGSDADLTIVDPNAQKTIRNEELVAKQPVSPWNGFELMGVPTAVVLRGEIAMRDGKPIGERRGRFVAAQHAKPGEVSGA